MAVAAINIFGASSYKSGMIMLTGYATSKSANDALCSGLKRLLSSDVRVRCPQPPPSKAMLPLPVPLWKGNNWFDMLRNSGLPKAQKLIESYIKEMEDNGVPSTKLVLAGMSQGGAVTLYTALNTKYKLAGIIGIVTWLPKGFSRSGPMFFPYLPTFNNTVESPADKKNVVNRNTPLLHINGREDLIVPIHIGMATRDALKKAIPNYTWQTYAGGHLTCCVTPLRGILKMRSWLKKYTPVSFKF